jgi:L-lactate dehydrogenase complex protein LldF
MTSPFYKKIRAALSDDNLQSALDGNAERRQASIYESFLSLPEDRDVYRQRAHQVRAKVIADLNFYLNQFESHLKTNGITIHHARDAEQAVKIILDIALQSKAKTVVKSKTMVGEEIHINHYLEDANIKVVETDLGEYIVQIRGEPPAHIITPAVHLNRSEVGHTFQEVLDVPYTNDVSELTQIARTILRHIFLEADIGISGVNFGVAESGTLCLVTNEGNGRMVTTLPNIHIALMGIERLVPSFDDLALMLDLLPRSATGQKLTVYTNLIHSPRRPGEVDGSLKRHLILLDNGRENLCHSPLNDILYCIRCGACLNVCPVFREIGGHAYIGREGQITPYPGPIGSVLSPGLFGISEFGQLARASSLCGACKDVCPVDIDIPKMLLRIRSAGQSNKISSFEWNTPVKATTIPLEIRVGLQLFTFFSSSASRFRLAQNMAGFFSQWIKPHSKWIPMPIITGWGLSRDFPKPSKRPFRSRFNQLDQADRVTNITNYAPLKDVGNRNRDTSDKSTSRESDLTRFEIEFTELGGTLTFCSKYDLGNLIVNFLNQRNIDRIQSWSEETLPSGLIKYLNENGIFTQQEADKDIRAGLTGTLVAISETGTILVPNGIGRPQTASLLPDIHLAVLFSDNIVADLSAALNIAQIKELSGVTLISGPSRTADIEMTLSIGVHGPEQVHIFCVNR